MKFLINWISNKFIRNKVTLNELLELKKQKEFDTSKFIEEQLKIYLGLSEALFKLHDSLDLHDSQYFHVVFRGLNRKIHITLHLNKIEFVFDCYYSFTINKVIPTDKNIIEEHLSRRLGSLLHVSKIVKKNYKLTEKDKEKIYNLFLIQIKKEL